MATLATHGRTGRTSLPRSETHRTVHFDLRPVALAVGALTAGLAPGLTTAQPVTNALPIRAVNGTAINATVAPTAGTVANPVMTVTQQTSATNRAVIEWNSFNIGRDARVDFVQPNTQSVLLNRVTVPGNSQIYGSLTANGRIFITNPSGVVFGGSTQVNVGSLMASSLDLTPAMAANGYQGYLQGAGVDLAGSGQFGVQVSRADNPGVNKIQTAQGGSVALVGGGFVDVGGVVQAPGGRISLAVAPAVQLTPVGKSGFVDLAITQAGASGSVTVGGLLNASSAVAGTTGGQVTLQAPRIETHFGESGNSVLSADGPAGGGSIALGDANTRSVIVGAGSILRADALARGDGGSIAVRATYNSAPGANGPLARTTFGVADVYGTLLARGGPNGGNGGHIETSGTALNTSLQLAGNPTATSAIVDARAQSAAGLSGTWTLDPFDVTITNAATVAVNGEFQPIGPGANVNAADISTALNNGTSVEINTGTAGVGSAAGDITLGAQTAITRAAGATPTTLTLRAHGNITLAGGSSIGVGTGAGPVNVNLYSDLDGNGSGAISMVGASIATGGGNVTFSGGLAPATGFASAGAQIPGVLVQGSTINTVGAANRGDVVIRGSSAGATASAVGETGVRLNGGTSIVAGNIAITGQASNGTAVRVDSASLATSTGLIQIRGVATRNLANTGRAIGVDLGFDTNVALAGGSLLIAGRGDENGLASAAPAIGVRADDLRVSGSAVSAGSITLAGQSVGSTGPGISNEDRESRGVDIAIDNDGQILPIGANVVIGASAGPLAARSWNLDNNTLRVVTNGAANLRPLGVDAAGNIVEQAAVPIVIGAASTVPAGSFGVTPALLNGPGVITGGVSAAQGVVIGSGAHTGLISLNAAAFPNQPTLALNLQNQGAGSAGIQVGGGNVLGTLALMSAGNIGQSGALNVQNLLVQGGAATRADLSNAGNVFTRIAFDGPQFLSVATQGNLTVDAVNGLGCNVATNTFAPVTLTNSVGGAQTVLRSMVGDVRLNRSITLPGAGAPTLDMATPASFFAGEGVGITGSAGSQWRVWTQAPANVTRGNLQAANLYGCAFGDTTACSISGVAIPAGNRFLFVDRPLLTVTANPANGVAGQAFPVFGYGVTGVTNGDAAETVLSGALGTTATAGSRAGTYTITQGTLTSPLGYRVQYQGADFNLTSPLFDIQDPSRQALQAGFLSDLRSDLYGRNLSLPYICTAASVAGNTSSDDKAPDPLASEWGKVRGLPQLSGCLDVKDGGQCAAF